MASEAETTISFVHCSTSSVFPTKDTFISHEKDDYVNIDVVPRGDFFWLAKQTCVDRECTSYWKKYCVEVSEKAKIDDKFKKYEYLKKFADCSTKTYKIDAKIYETKILVLDDADEYIKYMLSALIPDDIESENHLDDLQKYENKLEILTKNINKLHEFLDKFNDKIKSEPVDLKDEECVKKLRSCKGAFKYELVRDLVRDDLVIKEHHSMNENVYYDATHILIGLYDDLRKLEYINDGNKRKYHSVSDLFWEKIFRDGYYGAHVTQNLINNLIKVTHPDFRWLLEWLASDSLCVWQWVFTDE
jgi:hypothetical protein